MDLLSSLNPEQQQAVLHTEGPLLILAGAGSGKTRVLTTRIAWLVKGGRVAPAQILAVTFTNKAAREMLTRVAAMMTVNPRGMWIGTFHGTCARLLRLFHDDLGYAVSEADPALGYQLFTIDLSSWKLRLTDRTPVIWVRTRDLDGVSAQHVMQSLIDVLRERRAERDRRACRRQSIRRRGRCGGDSAVGKGHGRQRECRERCAGDLRGCKRRWKRERRQRDERGAGHQGPPRAAVYGDRRGHEHDRVDHREQRRNRQLFLQLRAQQQGG